MNGDAWLEEILSRYKEQKSLADRAIAQLSDTALFATLDADANSVAVIMKHLAGNLRSRWTDFLGSDGEKPDRARDTEFEMSGDTRADLVARWENAWRIVVDSIGSLNDHDLARTVVIRGEPHSVVQAISRNMTHTAQHVGQIVFLAKHLAGASWKTLSIPRGASDEFTRRLRDQRI